MCDTDDTPVPELQPGRKQTKQGRLWGYLRDDHHAGIDSPSAVWFSYSPDRKASWPAEHLQGYEGSYKPTAMRLTINYTPPEKSRKPDAGHM
jgi:hypothetical protein